MNEKASVLIVDDDAGMCETLCDILEDKGYSVVIARDGPTAVAEAGSRHFDLALIDIMMPGMNGAETLREIKRVGPGTTTMIMTGHDTLREIKRVGPGTTTMIMTGHDTLEEVVPDALKVGVDGVLYKPFEIDTIVEMIESKAEARTGPP